MLDFATVQESSDDPAGLRSLLRQLLGQPFLFFRVSYGDELTAHFGELREYSHPRMKVRHQGSSILGARASSWYFRPGSRPVMFVGTDEIAPADPTLARPLDVRDIEAGPLVEAGSVVSRIDTLPAPGGFGLLLGLSDRSTLVILPPPPSEPHAGDGTDDEDDVEVADWELFTPHDRYLRVGPGARWSYLDSSKPVAP